MAGSEDFLSVGSQWQQMAGSENFHSLWDLNGNRWQAVKIFTVCGVSMATECSEVVLKKKFYEKLALKSWRRQ